MGDAVRTNRLLSLVVSLSLLATLLPPAAQSGQPYLPVDPQLIVERLPRLALRPAPTAGPHSGVRSLGRARDDALAYLMQAQHSGDARYLGYAEAVLAPWRAIGAMPTELLLPQAIGEQARHDFSAALETLDRLLSRDPRDAQAWLTRSMILQVGGQVSAALRSCRPLAGRASHLVLATCIAGGQRLTADAPRAYRLLRSAVAEASVADRDIATWSLLVLADLAEASGDIAAATEALESAVQLEPGDIRPRIALADLLLRQGDAAAVLELVTPDIRAPMLLLRRALAAKALDLPAFEGLRARLQAHFDAAARRGDGLHEREAALANLRLFDRPDLALELARRNWEGQREYGDTQLVLAAALASGNPKAAQPVLKWLQAQGSLDVRLQPLMERVAGSGVGHAF